uniref:Uncharacterized protein n=1 Tax=Micrurus paraensis TaxID=1970185 RepID=A0A2D4KHG2_9SAUR
MDFLDSMLPTILGSGSCSANHLHLNLPLSIYIYFHDLPFFSSVIDGQDCFQKPGLDFSNWVLDFFSVKMDCDCLPFSPPPSLSASLLRHELLEVAVQKNN